MAAKSDFTADEWAKIVASPLLASVAVTAAEPSGLWGTLQEGFAGAGGLTGARDSTVSLIKEIVAALTTSEGRTAARDAVRAQSTGAANAAEIASRSIAALGDIASILDAKAGADASAVKQWIYANADRVANAATEGGFLGFGGEKVSASEKATLAQLASALRVTA